jgi:hypothetical protein
MCEPEPPGDADHESQLPALPSDGVYSLTAVGQSLTAALHPAADPDDEEPLVQSVAIGDLLSGTGGRDLPDAFQNVFLEATIPARQGIPIVHEIGATSEELSGILDDPEEGIVAPLENSPQADACGGADRPPSPDEVQAPAEEVDPGRVEESQTDTEREDEATIGTKKAGDSDRAPPEAGMTVQDDYQSPPTVRAPQPVFTGCVHSVSHLPPLLSDGDDFREHVLAKFLEHGTLPAPDGRGLLVQYVERQRVNSLCAGNFAEALRYQQISQRLQQLFSQQNTQEFVEKRLDAIELKLEDVAGAIDDYNQETERMIREELSRQDIRRRELEEGQAEKLSQFERHWNDEGFLSRFAKPSSDLLAVKRVERLLIIAKDLDAAEAARLRVAHLECEESESAQLRAEAEMRAKYAKMLQKQHSEMVMFVDTANAQLAVLESQREQGLRALLARQTQLAAEFESTKAARRQPLPGLSPQPGKADELAVTPRTVQRYSAFKTNVKQPKVVVKPLGALNQKKKRRGKRAKPGLSWE